MREPSTFSWVLIKTFKSLIRRVGRFGTYGQPHSAENRITILSNVLVLFGAVAAIGCYVQLVEFGFTGRFLGIYFVITGISLLVLALNYLGRRTAARVLVVVLLNMSAWNALIFYGKSFNGYYLFFCAMTYSIVAFDRRRSLMRWGALAVSFLGMPLTDYYSHNKVLPITGLDSANFPVSVLIFDSVVISSIIIIIVFIEKVLAEQNELDLKNLNKNLENIVDERTHLLKMAKEEAQAASQAKSQFVANTSHELRTPLGAIIGFVDIILSLNPSEKEKLEYLRIVRRNAHQLSLIVDEVLDLSKIEARKLSLKNEYFHLLNLLEDLQSLMALKAEEKGLKLEIETSGILPTEIYSDPLRLRQILVNLIGNAIKFTEKGKVSIRVKGKILPGDMFAIEFDIEDTGVGIVENDIGKLFQPFSQTDAGLMRKFGGTGLGLSLSKRLTEMLGGELKLVRTEVDQGSLFRINLACNGRVRPNFDLGDLQKRNEVATASLRNMEILITDDSPDNLLLIRRFLESAGAKVDFANNGKEALDKIQSQSGRAYSAILMDLQMPVMDGYEATRRLRRHGCKIPIIALTASAMKQERDKAIEEGFTDYLTKPVQRQLLVNTLSQWAAQL
jgi:signal transduction histidine kinase/CheY-like chemotaxis protein